MQKIEDATPQDEKDYPRLPKLTSKLQISDICCLNFGVAGIVSNCEISAVKFVGNNVRYDVEVTCNVNECSVDFPHGHVAVWNTTTIIRDVDSTFVEKGEVYEK